MTGVTHFVWVPSRDRQTFQFGPPGSRCCITGSFSILCGQRRTVAIAPAVVGRVHGRVGPSLVESVVGARAVLDRLIVAFGCDGGRGCCWWRRWSWRRGRARAGEGEGGKSGWEEEAWWWRRRRWGEAPGERRRGAWWAAPARARRERGCGRTGGGAAGRRRRWGSHWSGLLDLCR